MEGLPICITNMTWNNTANLQVRDKRDHLVSSTLPRCACNAADTVPGNSFGKMSKYGCHHDRVPVRASRYLASNMMKILVDMVREGEETVPPGRSEHRIGTQVAQ